MFEKFDLLDDIEPAVCRFEVRRVFQEIVLACDMAKTLRLTQVRDSYLSAEVVEMT